MNRAHFEHEHNIFRQSVRAFLEKEVVPHQAEWERDGIVSREVWKKAGDNGFLLPWADECYGGSGAKDFRYDQIVCEELARVNESGLMLHLHNSLVGPYIEHFGTAEQKERWLPPCVSGDSILAIAMTEPGAGSDLAGMKTTAVEKEDHFLLNGSKTFISNGLLSDLVIVAAKTASDTRHAIGLFMLERGMEGFERGRKLEKLGMRSQDTAELFFNNVKVPKTNLLGEKTKGFHILMQMLVHERVTLACSAVALSSAALKMTKEYVEQRNAFGSQVSKFQNTRFKLAEMKTEIDIAQVFVDKCVMDLNNRELSAASACEAKLFCSELLTRVADQCVQLHGGYGYMWEYPITQLYATARIYPIFAGTSEMMKEVIAKAMNI
uniref:MasA protein n=1 Tax=Azoarcus sp. HxN1 TaxID=83404 RepID=A9J4J8_9RHOO|nr:MasA protein [Azoarcus sp. HxN1]